MTTLIVGIVCFCAGLMSGVVTRCRKAIHMNEIMTSAGRMSKADAARMRFAKHYEIMRKYHTQVNRIKNGNIAKNNKTGRTGVWLDPKRNIYQAYITVNYKKMHLGCFDNYAEAVEARIEAEHKYYDPLIAAIEEEFS